MGFCNPRNIQHILFCPCLDVVLCICSKIVQFVWDLLEILLLEAIFDSSIFRRCQFSEMFRVYKPICPFTNPLSTHLSVHPSHCASRTPSHRIMLIHMHKSLNEPYCILEKNVYFNVLYSVHIWFSIFKARDSTPPKILALWRSTSWRRCLKIQDCTCAKPSMPLVKPYRQRRSKLNVS